MPKEGRQMRKRKRSPEKSEEKSSDAPKKAKAKPGKTATTKPLQNKATTDYADLVFTCDKKNANGKVSNLKISSWNVDGLRAWIKKNGLEYVGKEDPDVVCFQETKCSLEKIPDEANDVEGYHKYFNGAKKEGYSGVAVYSKAEPSDVKYGFGVEEFDDEGRCITLEFEEYFLVNVYVPNAGRGLVTLPKRLSWNESFKKYIKDLDSKKPVIVCGDMNVAHKEIDLKNPSTNKKNAGFTPEERQGMTEFLEEGFADAYRELYPDEKDVYTFWSYMSNARAKNVGWRLDYFVVSKRLMDDVCDVVVRDKVYGSDHCPITMFLNV